MRKPKETLPNFNKYILTLVTLILLTFCHQVNTLIASCPPGCKACEYCQKDKNGDYGEKCKCFSCTLSHRLKANQCEKCSIDYCMNCDNNTQSCKRCIDGYHRQLIKSTVERISKEAGNNRNLGRNFNFRCKKCPDNCSTCTQADQCSQCRLLYTINGNKKGCSRDDSLIVLIICGGFLLGILIGISFFYLSRKIKRQAKDIIKSSKNKRYLKKFGKGKKTNFLKQDVELSSHMKKKKGKNKKIVYGREKKAGNRVNPLKVNNLFDPNIMSYPVKKPTPKFKNFQFSYGENETGSERKSSCNEKDNSSLEQPSKDNIQLNTSSEANKSKEFQQNLPQINFNTPASARNLLGRQNTAQFKDLSIEGSGSGGNQSGSGGNQSSNSRQSQDFQSKLSGSQKNNPSPAKESELSFGKGLSKLNKLSKRGTAKSNPPIRPKQDSFGVLPPYPLLVEELEMTPEVREDESLDCHEKRLT